MSESVNERVSNTGAGAEPAAPKVELRLTGDGSATLFVPELNEHYHSHHGARQESAHVFIRHGLAPLLAVGAASAAAPLRILEVGLGTGLNALLTLEAGQAAGSYIAYDGLETFPLPPEVAAALQPEWEQRGPDLSRHFAHLHAAPWNVPVEMGPISRFRKWRSRCKPLP